MGFLYNHDNIKLAVWIALLLKCYEWNVIVGNNFYFKFYYVFKIFPFY